ncbi:uncharacterized protein BcabD6B2_57160 [Babesia caballi]|uniref:GLTSCR protein conserved domain-containing protein n=1 Tax=Babesia caballi TaxID=5871 RepID=A0AAV4M262_BABCB|nr:hypothetical protein, conserved [Babesia caballi]
MYPSNLGPGHNGAPPEAVIYRYPQHGYTTLEPQMQAAPMDPNMRRVTMMPIYWRAGVPPQMRGVLTTRAPIQQQAMVMGAMPMSTPRFRPQPMLQTVRQQPDMLAQHMMNIVQLPPGVGTTAQSQLAQGAQTPVRSPKDMSGATYRRSSRGRGRGRRGDGTRRAYQSRKAQLANDGPPGAIFDIIPRPTRPGGKKAFPVPAKANAASAERPAPMRKLPQIIPEDTSALVAAELAESRSPSDDGVPISKPFGSTVSRIPVPQGADTWPLRMPVPQQWPGAVGGTHPAAVMVPPVAIPLIAQPSMQLQEMAMAETGLINMDPASAMALVGSMSMSPDHGGGPVTMDGSVMTPVTTQPVTAVPMAQMSAPDGSGAPDLHSQVSLSTPNLLASPPMGDAGTLGFTVPYVVAPAMGPGMPVSAMDPGALMAPQQQAVPVVFAVNSAMSSANNVGPIALQPPMSRPVGLAIPASMAMPSAVTPVVPMAPPHIPVASAPMHPEPLEHPPQVKPPGPAQHGGSDGATEVPQQAPESIVDEIKKDKQATEEVHKDHISAPRIILESFQQVLDNKRRRMRECLAEDCKNVLGEHSKVDTPYQSTIEDGVKHFYVKDIVAKLLPYHMFYYDTLLEESSTVAEEPPNYDERISALKRRLGKIMSTAQVSQQNFECTRACTEALKKLTLTSGGKGKAKAPAPTT